MCGIAGVYLRDPKLVVDLDNLLDTMLDQIQHRGGDATGYLALDSNGVAEWHRAACDVRDFSKYRRPVPTGTRILMGHTRYATQGLPAFMENNHPIRRGSFYVIHNGHVSNDQELFKLADRVPFGQVDSEAIPARLASLGSLDKGHKVMSEIEGAAAIAAVDANKPRQLLLARGNSSPLYVLVTDKIVMWGSTEATVKVAYKKCIGRLPKRQKIENVPEGTMILVNSRSITRTKFEPKRTVWVSKYTHHWMDDEIDRDYQAASSLIPVAQSLPTVGGWPKLDPIDAEDVEIDGETVECDVCGTTMPWQSASYKADPNSDFAWTLCDKCEDVELDVESDLFGIEILDRPTESFSVVNAAILDEDEEGVE